MTNPHPDRIVKILAQNILASSGHAPRQILQRVLTGILVLRLVSAKNTEFRKNRDAARLAADFYIVPVSLTTCPIF